MALPVKTPQFSGPVVDAKGNFTQAFRIIWNQLWALALGNNVSATVQLVPTQLLAGSVATIFTASTAATRVDKVTMCNIDASAHTVTLYYVPLGQSAIDANKVLDAVSIAAGTTYEPTAIEGQVLSKGDSIRAFADTASKVTIMISGTYIS